VKKLIVVMFVAAFGMSCQALFTDKLCEADFSSVTNGLIAQRNNQVSLIRAQDELIGGLTNQFNFLAKQPTPDQEKIKELQQRFKTETDKKNKLGDALFIIGLKLDVALKSETVFGSCKDEEE